MQAASGGVALFVSCERLQLLRFKRRALRLCAQCFSYGGICFFAWVIPHMENAVVLPILIIGRFALAKNKLHEFDIALTYWHCWLGLCPYP